jgi:hypothetical protein
MRHSCLPLLAGLVLAGCGFDRAPELQSRTDQLNAQSAAASQACDVSVPAGNQKTAVMRAKCQVDAVAIRRPIVTYPDLLDSYLAARMAVAEQVQAGKLTVAKGSEVIAHKISELVAEEKRRNIANRSASTQETVAPESIVLASPHSCTRAADSAKCF